MIILGLSGIDGRDAAAALLEDGSVLATASEESFAGVAHAPGRLPWDAIRSCLQQAGMAANAIDAVAVAHTPATSLDPALWRNAARLLGEAPRHALALLRYGLAEAHTAPARIRQTLLQHGMAADHLPVHSVSPALAQAAATYTLVGWEGPATLLCLDGNHVLASPLLAQADQGRIAVLHTLPAADSTTSLITAMASYLGMSADQAQQGLPALAEDGDPGYYDMGRLLYSIGSTPRVNVRLINPLLPLQSGQAPYSQALPDWLGPPATAESNREDPWVHYAAGVQQLCTDAVLRWLDGKAASWLQGHGRLLVSGEGAANPGLIKALQAHPQVNTLLQAPWPPGVAAALGAAALIAGRHGLRVSTVQAKSKRRRTSGNPQ